jgi:hypothetical protein
MSLQQQLLLLVLASALGLSSCAPGSKGTPTATSSARKSLSERLDPTKPEPSSYTQDSEGKWGAQTSKRSSFEGKSDANFTSKNLKKQPYKTSDFAKKSWLGSKDYAAQKSDSGTKEASGLQKSAMQQGKNARESATPSSISQKAYTTGDYATTSARESGAAGVKTGSNALIENRRKGYQQPEVTDWTQRRDLSLEQTRGIIGR